MDKIKVIALVGPTASGKTALSVALAQKYNCEIISADSMQIYKNMQIATAKPTEQEKQGIKHYLMDFLDVNKAYNVSDYVNDAKKAIEEIVNKGKTPLIVGGTGLYVDSLLSNIEFTNEDEDKSIRLELEKEFNENGIEALYERLIEIDPIAANEIHKNNTKRVIRALEIYQKTGLNLTENKKRSRRTPSIYNCKYIGLTCNDREKLYDRINRRIDIMLSEGLIDETKNILSMELSDTSKMAIGYKELKPYLEGKLSIEEAVENLKRETRRYAKRQLTWFRRNNEINWIETDLLCFDNEKILESAAEILKDFL